MARWRRGAPVAAMAVVIAGIGVGAAEAAAPPPPLRLSAAARAVTADRLPDGTVRFDLGLRVVAGREPFEVRARRAGYGKPILGYRIVEEGGQRTRVQLPTGLITGLHGLDDFATIDVTDGSGRTVARYRTSFCGNSAVSGPARRDAPPANPYPERCGGEHPFALGVVWGVQAGWTAAVGDRPPAPLRLPAGDYTATATVAGRYRKVFGIPDRHAVTTVTVTVADGPARTAPAVRPASGAPRPAVAPPSVLRGIARDGPQPDLRPLPAWDVAAVGRNGRWFVTFRATIWNGGTSALVVDGFRDRGAASMAAYQRGPDDRGGPAGALGWDGGRWRLADVAGYSLLADDRTVARRGTGAFCLAATDVVDHTIAGARWRPENTDPATACGTGDARSVRQVLDVGNGVTGERPGQSFDVTDLPNGIYHIRIIADPGRRLVELGTANNTALRTIVLGGTATERTVTAPPVHGVTG